MVDPYEYLGFIRNPDGTITRKPNHFPTTAATPDSTSVLSKDVQINQSTNTWARIFLPHQQLQNPSPPATKLPLIVYFHGGGFVLLSAFSTSSHDYCLNIAAELPAVVVSIEYRLAPEHRLPAAYDDAVEALHWIRSRSSEDEWLEKHADFSNCFLMGTSAGANIAYHVALRTAEIVNELDPLRIQGVILSQPFFGGVQRSGSELRLIADPVLPVHVSDVMWDLSLPIGADKDHEYCNPTVEGGSNVVEKIKSLGWKVLISGCEGDPLYDRQIEVAELMEEKGVNVVRRFVAGGFHGVELFDVAWCKDMYALLKDFVSSTN